MKISAILGVPSVKILLFMLEKGEIRYTDLADLFTSRGTLSLSLSDLEEEKLIQRRIVASKPIQAYYSLTQKGKEIAKLMNEMKRLL